MTFGQPLCACRRLGGSAALRRCDCDTVCAHICSHWFSAIIPSLNLKLKSSLSFGPGYQAALHEIPEYQPTDFAGAIGMMAREWGGMLKSSERVEFRRLRRTCGVFDTYITEGDGLRQAARNR